MVRRQAYDLTEFAIVTAIQALAYGEPIVLLPLVVASDFRRGCIVARRSEGPIDRRSLVGAKPVLKVVEGTTLRQCWPFPGLNTAFNSRRSGLSAPTPLTYTNGLRR